MPKLQVFDPAMCCSTGVCGPSVDPALPRFAADLEWLKSKGIEIERHNLAQEVAAFTSNLAVKTALNSKGSKRLPLLLLDGKDCQRGRLSDTGTACKYHACGVRAGAGYHERERKAAIRNNWSSGQAWRQVIHEATPRSDSEPTFYGQRRRWQDFDCLCSSRFTGGRGKAGPLGEYRSCV